MAKKVGLICAPELPETIAENIYEELIDYFNRQVDDNYDWEIEIVVDPLTGAAESSKEIIDAALSIAKKREWDYTICLTDLPLFEDNKIILADLNQKLNIAQISLPAFGSPPMRYRVKKVIMQIMQELHFNHTKDDVHKMKQAIKHLFKRNLRFSPIKREEVSMDQNKAMIRYLVVPKINSKLRTILGMSYANRPWAVISSFKPIIAVAFATGAYALIFPNLWELSVHYNVPRLLGIMFIACMSMIIWMIVSHNLWENKTKNSKRKIRRLYNTTTVTTLTMAVSVYYIVLFIIFSIAIVIFIPPELFRTMTESEGEVGILAFLRLSWLATSVATLAGSIGASAENAELVRNIAYGYRQNRRYQEVKKQKD